MSKSVSGQVPVHAVCASVEVHFRLPARVPPALAAPCSDSAQSELVHLFWRDMCVTVAALLAQCGT